MIVQFYHLTETPLEKALPRVLEKAYQQGIRCLVVAKDEAQATLLDQALWTYHPQAFLPHGMDTGPEPARQPILLATDETDANGATLFCTTAGRIPARGYERVVDMVDGFDDAGIARAQERRAAYRAQGAQLRCFRQEKGAWVEGE